MLTEPVPDVAALSSFSTPFSWVPAPHTLPIFSPLAVPSHLPRLWTLEPLRVQSSDSLLFYLPKLAFLHSTYQHLPSCGVYIIVWFVVCPPLPTAPPSPQPPGQLKLQRARNLSVLSIALFLANRTVTAHSWYTRNIYWLKEPQTPRVNRLPEQTLVSIPTGVLPGITTPLEPRQWSPQSVSCHLSWESQLCPPLLSVCVCVGGSSYYHKREIHLVSVVHKSTNIHLRDLRRKQHRETDLCPARSSPFPLVFVF